VIDLSDDGTWSNLVTRGSRLDEAAALQLEVAVAQNPHDDEQRAVLVGWLFPRQADPRWRECRRGHVLWFVEHHPGTKFAGTPHATFHPVVDPDGFTAASDLWRKHVDEHARDARVLANAARFFSFAEPARARRLLKQARALEPSEPEWMSELARELRHCDEWPEVLALYEQLIATGPTQRRLYLGDAAEAALRTGDRAKARALAGQLLESIPSQEPWNRGNAIFQGHAILGAVALAEGDVARAREHLLASGRTDGSPQLDSFGPELDLADRLLQAGETAAVLEFLGLCEKFWKPGKERLERFATAIRRGERPRLHRLRG
jgi:hypothetical protein